MNQYELAFERFLRSARAPYLANRQERRFQLGGGKTLKNFDFVVTGMDGASWFVDVKGRRFPGGLA
ncbi:MAG: HYExAFE family protein [Thermoguttaceae bacterium]|nr:HYExAFE family protein [Thermoguttaceae bacterium]